MTLAEAKRIGSRRGMTPVGPGVLIAKLIMTFVISYDVGFIKAFFLFTDFD